MLIGWVALLLDVFQSPGFTDTALTVSCFVPVVGKT
jgi:hypothetical protein